MTISRNTFDPAKNYKRVRYHQDRDLLDSELNEQQDITHLEHRKMWDLLIGDGFYMGDTPQPVSGNIVTMEGGAVYVDGALEMIPGATLTYDPGKTSGVDVVYIELLKYNIDHTQDTALINPATGEPTAEREKWVLSYKAADTSGGVLPNNVTERKVVPVLFFDRATGVFMPVREQRLNLPLEALQGMLPGERITVGSITEDHLAFAAAEGLQSLLQNLAERTYDQAGSYLVEGFNTFLGGVDGSDVEVITNAGRAYIRGFRFHREWPNTTHVPKSVAVKAVRGEQKTFNSSQRRYPLNNGPLQATTQVEAIVEITANVTRGSVAGGEDLLTPNPVVDIIEVSQGATVYQEGVDWQQSGNSVDWLGTGNAPAIGTTYSVRWTYTKQMVKNTDYVDGGWFGVAGHPAPGTYHYVVTAFDATGETVFEAGSIISITTAARGLNLLTWLPVAGAQGYRVYRATNPGSRTNFLRLIQLGPEAISYVDDGVETTTSSVPPQSSPTTLDMSAFAIAPGDTDLINFGRTNLGDQPISGSNCSVDYNYYLGRRDIIYATTSEIKRLEGAPADNPKLPILPDGALGLCSVECPPNSTALVVRNFRLTRITMDQIHTIIRDVEALKYNDAQYQMNNDLQNRDAQTKKGIYSDDFSNDAQSDRYHPQWSARIDPIYRFVAPDRTATPNVLAVDYGNSQASFSEGLAMLPSTETLLINQTQWSGSKNINPHALFEKPRARIEISPNTGRRGFTDVHVRGMHFTPNAANVSVHCDGELVLSGLTADSSGALTAMFTIPADVRDGTRIVLMSDGVYEAKVGMEINAPLDISRILRVASGDEDGEGSQLAASPGETALMRIIRKIVTTILWKIRTWPTRVDPLAQTFRFEWNQVVSGIGLFFTSKDAFQPVNVQVRGITNGVPNGTVYAEKSVAPGDIVYNTETRIDFDDPFYAEAGKRYALVIGSESPLYEVRVAQLGQMGQDGLITRLDYTEGALFESANAEAWTPLPDTSLTMKVYGRKFDLDGVVRFMPITGVQFAAFNIDEYSTIPEGCAMLWEYSMNGGVSWDALVPAEEERLPNLATQVLVRVRLASNADNDSPVLSFRDVNLIGYLNGTAGVYVTRENELAQGVASTKVYAQMDIPSGTTIQWFCSNNGGATWEAMTIDVTRPITEEWTEYTLMRTFTNNTGNRVRYKASMTGTPLVYPRIHTLGATLS